MFINYFIIALAIHFLIGMILFQNVLNFQKKLQFYPKQYLISSQIIFCLTWLPWTIYKIIELIVSGEMKQIVKQAKIQAELEERKNSNEKNQD